MHEQTESAQTMEMLEEEVEAFRNANAGRGGANLKLEEGTSRSSASHVASQTS
jgi:hypothetical protein